MQAGWYHDPTGRHGGRYHDGSAWTAHVDDGGSVTADPEGRDQLRSTPLASTPSESRNVAEFFERLGAEPRGRPAVRLATVVAGFGGGFLAIGLLAFASDADSAGPVVALGLASIALGLVLRLTPGLSQFDVLLHAGTGAGAVGVGATAVGFGILVGGNGGARLGYAVAALLFLVLWATRGFKERPTFFGLGIASLVYLVADLFRDTSPLYSDDYFYDDSYYSSGGSALDWYVGGLGETVTRQGVVFLVLGLLLVVLVVVSDRRRLEGLGTAFAANAIASSVLGAVLILPELSNAGGCFLLALVGTALGVVGAVGRRRATTWVGGSLAAVGVAGFLVATFEPSSPVGVALVFLTGGALLIGAAPAARAIRDAQGGDRSTRSRSAT